MPKPDTQDEVYVATVSDSAGRVLETYSHAEKCPAAGFPGENWAVSRAYKGVIAAFLKSRVGEPMRSAIDELDLPKLFGKIAEAEGYAVKVSSLGTGLLKTWNFAGPRKGSSENGIPDASSGASAPETRHIDGYVATIRDPKSGKSWIDVDFSTVSEIGCSLDETRHRRARAAAARRMAQDMMSPWITECLDDREVLRIVGSLSERKVLVEDVERHSVPAPAFVNDGRPEMEPAPSSGFRP